jgi:hypothetical protein
MVITKSSSPSSPLPIGSLASGLVTPEEVAEAEKKLGRMHGITELI